MNKDQTENVYDFFDIDRANADRYTAIVVVLNAMLMQDSERSHLEVLAWIQGNPEYIKDERRYLIYAVTKLFGAVIAHGVAGTPTDEYKLVESALDRIVHLMPVRNIGFSDVPILVDLILSEKASLV